MSEKDLIEIEPSKSTLGRLIYRRPGSLARHIQRTLVHPYDSLVLYKFRDHLPEINTVYLNLEFLETTFKWLGYDIAVYPTLRVVRVLQLDWFIEICAGLSAIGGIAALATFLRQIRRDGRVHRREQHTRTYGVPVDAGFDKLQMRRQVSRQIEDVYYDNIDNFDIKKIHEYYEEQLEYIETYDINIRIMRLIYRTKDKEGGTTD